MAANVESTSDKILEKIDELLPKTGLSRSTTEPILHLAEAYAWLVRPDQPHGATQSSHG